MGGEALRMTACDRIARGLFYRGQNLRDNRRIRTGASFWDDLMFVADNERAARAYGSAITSYRMRPGARLLCEGSRDFQAIAGRWRTGESLLTFAERAARSAADAGYDAVWFKRQSDVGTAVINRDVLVPVEVRL